MNGKRLFTLLPLLLLGLSACNGGQSGAITPTKLRYGTLIGNQAEDRITHTSQLTFIKKSYLARLVQDKENFLLLLHGSEDTCTCYTQWHDEILAPYIKKNKLLVYAITLDEFETDSEYYGLKRVRGYDTLAVFQDGVSVHQKCTDDQTDPFVTTYANFADWMLKRIQNPKIFYVNETILDSYYAGNQAFTIYFARGTCGDCGYLDRTALRSYLDSHDIAEKNLFVFDFDVYRPSAGEEDYEEKMQIYQNKKDKFGLSSSEFNPAGYGQGAFPTVYYVNPDGLSYTGDVIEASGVFYNESINKETGAIKGSYFTEERLEEGGETFLSYLSSSQIETKVLEGKTAPEGSDRHERLSSYTEPIFNALMDYCVGA